MVEEIAEPGDQQRVRRHARQEKQQGVGRRHVHPDVWQREELGQQSSTGAVFFKRAPSSAVIRQQPQKNAFLLARDQPAIKVHEPARQERDAPPAAPAGNFPTAKADDQGVRGGQGGAAHGDQERIGDNQSKERYVPVEAILL